MFNPEYRLEIKAHTVFAVKVIFLIRHDFKSEKVFPHPLLLYLLEQKNLRPLINPWLFVISE